MLQRIPFLRLQEWPEDNEKHAIQSHQVHECWRRHDIPRGKTKKRERQDDPHSGKQALVEDNNGPNRQALARGNESSRSSQTTSLMGDIIKWVWRTVPSKNSHQSPSFGWLRRRVHSKGDEGYITLGTLSTYGSITNNSLTTNYVLIFSFNFLCKLQSVHLTPNLPFHVFFLIQ